MIVIINGSLGVGKTATAWALAEKFTESVMIDGDYIGAIFPKDYNDDEWTAYLYKTIAKLISFHQKNGFVNFVVNYVFENSEILAAFLKQLTKLDEEIKTFYLSCEAKEQRERIIKRNNSDLAWELERYGELNKALETSAVNAYIGFRIDTSKKTLEEVLEEIWNKYLWA